MIVANINSYKNKQFSLNNVTVRLNKIINNLNEQLKILIFSHFSLFNHEGLQTQVKSENRKIMYLCDEFQCHQPEL